MHPVVTLLKRRGWKVGLRSSPIPLLPEHLQREYSDVPAGLVNFIAPLDFLENAAENVWFLTATHYNQLESEGFRWNEYKCMALDEAESPEAAAKIENFWSSHLPFALAVHSDYDYLAVKTRGALAGSVVHGFAPFWEEPSVIAPNFMSFLKRYSLAAESEVLEFPYSLFL